MLRKNIEIPVKFLNFGSELRFRTITSNNEMKEGFRSKNIYMCYCYIPQVKYLLERGSRVYCTALIKDRVQGRSN